MSNLARLDLSSSGITGSIPSEIGLMSNLTSLELESNDLAVSVPSEIGLMTSLTSLGLDSNDLIGTIPSEIGLLSSLTDLDISLNALTGTIPSEIGLMASLVHLDLYKNDLSGTVPSEIGLMTSLTYLGLDWNDLTGSIPSEIGLMSNLTSLELASNDLIGTIPSEIGLLSSLTSLDLASNDLTGTIPSDIGRMTNLTSLSLYRNDLSGTIPSEIGNMKSLGSLSLSWNALTGTIPQEICGIISSLDVLGNNLTSCYVVASTMWWPGQFPPSSSTHQMAININYDEDSAITWLLQQDLSGECSLSNARAAGQWNSVSGEDAVAGSQEQANFSQSLLSETFYRFLLTDSEGFRKTHASWVTITTASDTAAAEENAGSLLWGIGFNATFRHEPSAFVWVDGNRYELQVYLGVDGKGLIQVAEEGDNAWERCSTGK